MYDVCMYMYVCICMYVCVREWSENYRKDHERQQKAVGFRDTLALQDFVIPIYTYIHTYIQMSYTISLLDARLAENGVQLGPPKSQHRLSAGTYIHSIIHTYMHAYT